LNLCPVSRTKKKTKQTKMPHFFFFELRFSGLQSKNRIFESNFRRRIIADNPRKILKTFRKLYNLTKKKRECIVGSSFSSSPNFNNNTKTNKTKQKKMSFRRGGKEPDWLRLQRKIFSRWVSSFSSFFFPHSPPTTNFVRLFFFFFFLFSFFCKHKTTQHTFHMMIKNLSGAPEATANTVPMRRRSSKHG